jgi:isopenicillin N synthase-like dioxygenase
MVSFNPIPTVDLSSFTSSATTGASIDIARQETAKQLARACHLNGCVGITGHGVSSELLKRGFEIAEKLFDLPMEDKLKAPHPKGSVPHRGYSAPGMEKAYTKEDLERDEDHKEKLRQIVDCKV